MKWGADDVPARRALLLRDIRPRPKPREGTVKNLYGVQRLRQVYLSRDELLVVGDSNDQPTRVFNRCGEVRALDRFGGNFARFRMAIVTGMRIITGGGAQGMRKPVLLRREAGFFDRRRRMQMHAMPIMGVCQEGCAAEHPQNQHWDQYHSEHETSTPRPNNSIQERAASGGSAGRHRHGCYRPGSTPSMTDHPRWAEPPSLAFASLDDRPLRVPCARSGLLWRLVSGLRKKTPRRNAGA